MKMKKMMIAGFCVAVVGIYAAASLAVKEIVINPGKQLSLGGVDAVAAAFTKKTGVVVNMAKVGGCGFTVKGVSSGSLNAGAMCCPATKDETGKLGFVDSAIGRDAIQFIVAAANPVKNLTTQQLRDIYQGKIKNWKEVGGHDAPIKPYAHIMCGNREEVMRQYLTGVRNPKTGTITIDNRKFAPWVTNIKDETDVCKTVAADPNGIAPVSRSMVEGAVKVLAVDGVMPTPETIANETYPVVRYLHIVTKGYPQGALRQFIDFAKSREGQAILARQGKIIPLP